MQGLGHGGIGSIVLREGLPSDHQIVLLEFVDFVEVYSPHLHSPTRNSDSPRQRWSRFQEFLHIELLKVYGFGCFGLLVTTVLLEGVVDVPSAGVVPRN